MKDAGIRFDENLYVRFSLDPSNGDMVVAVEVTIEGVTNVVTGAVVWDE